ncbi:hypothetical protein GCM10022252_23530 [Streptosporangium oxazolinicum]|uniref:Uncharacterized protein n=1 Tax=Streptosporangium oxazolinicum TaxID=909287 RepID=A0ABP8AQW5_9ACTN
MTDPDAKEQGSKERPHRGGRVFPSRTGGAWTDFPVTRRRSRNGVSKHAPAKAGRAFPSHTDSSEADFPVAHQRIRDRISGRAPTESTRAFLSRADEAGPAFRLSADGTWEDAGWTGTRHSTGPSDPEPEF